MARRPPSCVRPRAAPARGVSAPTEVLAIVDLAKAAARVTAGVRLGDVPVRHDEVHPREADAAVPRAGIATASERAEWTLPPERWMDRSHCRRDV